MYPHTCRDIFPLRDGFGILYETWAQIGLNAAGGNPRLCCCPGQSLVSRGPSLVAGGALQHAPHRTSARVRLPAPQHTDIWGGATTSPGDRAPKMPFPGQVHPPQHPPSIPGAAEPQQHPGPLSPPKGCSARTATTAAPPPLLQTPPGTGMGLFGGQGRDPGPPRATPFFLGATVGAGHRQARSPAPPRGAHGAGGAAPCGGP